MKQVFILQNIEDNSIVAIYTDLNVLNKVKKVIENKLDIDTEVITKNVNPDIKSFK